MNLTINKLFSSLHINETHPVACYYTIKKSCNERFSEMKGLHGLLLSLDMQSMDLLPDPNYLVIMESVEVTQRSLTMDVMSPITK